MKQTMSIGTFSRLTGLTPKALRLYERRGLLRPARVDPGNGYRYYEVRQLRQAEIVRLLRTLGVPVDQIREVLGSASPDDLTRILAAERKRLDREMRQLSVYRAFLERMSTLHAMACQEPAVELVEVPAVGGLRTEIVVRRDEFDPRYWAAVDELQAEAKRCGLRQSAREIVILPPDRLEEAAMVPNHRLTLHAEVFLPLQAPRKLQATLSLSVLPACLAARTVFRGPYWEGYRLAYESQLEWLLASPFTLGGPMRERYVCGTRDTRDTERHETELVWPLVLRGDTA